MFVVVGLAALASVDHTEATSGHFRGGWLGWRMLHLDVDDSPTSVVINMPGVNPLMCGNVPCPSMTVEFMGRMGLSLDTYQPAGVATCLSGSVLVTPCKVATGDNIWYDDPAAWPPPFEAVYVNIDYVDYEHCYAEGDIVDAAGLPLDYRYPLPNPVTPVLGPNPFTPPWSDFVANPIISGPHRTASVLCDPPYAPSPHLDVQHVNNGAGINFKLETIVTPWIAHATGPAPLLGSPNPGSVTYPNFKSMAWCPAPPATGTTTCSFPINSRLPVNLPNDLQNTILPRTYALSTSAEAGTGYKAIGAPGSGAANTPTFANDVFTWNIAAGDTYYPMGCGSGGGCPGDTLYSMQLMTRSGLVSPLTTGGTVKAPVDFMVRLGCDNAVPYAPEDLEATPLGPTTVKLDWKAPSMFGCPHAYQVYRGAIAGFPLSSAVLVCTTSTLTCNDSVAMCGVAYYRAYAVTTTSPVLTSEPSNEVMVLTTPVSGVANLPACIACPPPLSGWAPDCIPPCPPGTSGGFPSCTVNCPPSTSGSFPSCNVDCPPPMSGSIPDCDPTFIGICGTFGTLVYTSCQSVLPRGNCDGIYERVPETNKTVYGQTCDDGTTCAGTLENTGNGQGTYSEDCVVPEECDAGETVVALSGGNVPDCDPVCHYEGTYTEGTTFVQHDHVVGDPSWEAEKEFNPTASQCTGT